MCIYYTDMSVLLENVPIVIVVFIKATSGIDDVIARYFPVRHSCLYVIKKTLHSGLKIWILFSCTKREFYSLAACACS